MAGLLQHNSTGIAARAAGTYPSVNHKDFDAVAALGVVFVGTVEGKVGLINPVESPGRIVLDVGGVDLERGLGREDRADVIVEQRFELRERGGDRGAIEKRGVSVVAFRRQGEGVGGGAEAGGGGSVGGRDHKLEVHGLRLGGGEVAGVTAVGREGAERLDEGFADGRNGNPAKGGGIGGRGGRGDEPGDGEV